MIKITSNNDNIILSFLPGDLAPRHKSQLSYWGFILSTDNTSFTHPDGTNPDTIAKLTNYLKKRELHYDIDNTTLSILKRVAAGGELQNEASINGTRIKNGLFTKSEYDTISVYAKNQLIRSLKDHQLKAALHLFAVSNGANFSVPGSGKTTVVLTVFCYLRSIDLIDSLFVVGPPACFDPWINEYEAVTGEPASFDIFAGGNVSSRHIKYKNNLTNTNVLYLSSFQTFSRDKEEVVTLFKHQGIRFFLVVDEAHYIKQLGGMWANALLNLAPYATRRCILTGTPFPKSYSDAFNLFDFLWPNNSPLNEKDKHRIHYYSKNHDEEQASKILNNRIGPLFYRVRKSELHLAPQHFLPPVSVSMNDTEARIYKTITDKIITASQSDYFRDLNTAIKLKKGRLMRLRQCLSYPKLLSTAIDDYDEKLLEGDNSLADIIVNYDNYEKPAKLVRLLEIVSEHSNKREKVVIWSNFVKTIEYIANEISKMDIGVRIIYGATPSESKDYGRDDITRERIVREFISDTSGINVLVANPAACAESISLHKTCSNAIYYDLSYNCAPRVPQFARRFEAFGRLGCRKFNTLE